MDLRLCKNALPNALYQYQPNKSQKKKNLKRKRSQQKSVVKHSFEDRLGSVLCTVLIYNLRDQSLLRQQHQISMYTLIP